MPAYESVLREALALGADERELLVAQLFDSLASTPTDQDEADLRASVTRRVEQYEAGEIRGVSWDVARTAVFPD